jgi:hypothetical protein
MQRHQLWKLGAILRIRKRALQGSLLLQSLRYSLFVSDDLGTNCQIGWQYHIARTESTLSFSNNRFYSVPLLQMHQDTPKN